MKRLSLREVAELYTVLKPFLVHSDTYEDLFVDIYRKDIEVFNQIFEMVTYSKSGPIDGEIIIYKILEALKRNNFGAFVSWMQEGKENGSKNR